MAVLRKNCNSQETVEDCFVQYVVCVILVNRVLGVDFCVIEMATTSVSYG